MSKNYFNIFLNYTFIISLVLCSQASEIFRRLPFSERRGKIVGGEIINIEQAPFNVAVEYESKQVCGGSILNPKWVVTAAHCFNREFYMKLLTSIRVGTGQRHFGGTEHSVIELLRHPNYVKGVNDCDVALVKVHLPMKYSNSVSPIALPNEFYKPNENEYVQVFGFGYTIEAGNPSELLRYVFLPMFNHQECVLIYRDVLNVTNQMTCAGFREGSRDACVLDSGGPLVWKGKLYGIVSWGYGCARKMHPGVFTDLTSHTVRQWILDNIRH